MMEHWSWIGSHQILIPGRSPAPRQIYHVEARCQRSSHTVILAKISRIQQLQPPNQWGCNGDNGGDGHFGRSSQAPVCRIDFFWGHTPQQRKNSTVYGDILIGQWNMRRSFPTEIWTIDLILKITPACILCSSQSSSSMGNESEEYLLLVSDTSPEDGLGHRNSKTTSRCLLASREKLLVLVILLQALALVASVLTRTRNTGVTCQCPHSDRSILYCRPFILT
jgi:hypothetical protein